MMIEQMSRRIGLGLAVVLAFAVVGCDPSSSGSAADGMTAAESFERGTDKLYGQSSPDATGIDDLRAAANQGHKEAALWLARALDEGLAGEQQPEAAVRWRTRAAESGSPIAAYELGEQFQSGRHVERDLVEAKRWFEQSAAAGHPPAQFALSEFYIHGLAGSDTDYARAKALLEPAAQQGYPEAMYALGVIHDRGLSVDPDLPRARELYLQAARAGNAAGMLNVANMMFDGVGGDVDQIDAVAWGLKAQALLPRRSAGLEQGLATWRAQLTDAQWDQARARAETIGN